MSEEGKKTLVLYKFGVATTSRAWSIAYRYSEFNTFAKALETPTIFKFPQKGSKLMRSTGTNKRRVTEVIIVPCILCLTLMQRMDQLSTWFLQVFMCLREKMSQLKVLDAHFRFVVPFIDRPFSSFD
jgi:hypothetical protein